MITSIADRSSAAFLANQVSTVYPKAPAGTFYYGDPGVPRQFTKNSPWQFSPNVGLSLDPFGTGKTVVRHPGTLSDATVIFLFTAEAITSLDTGESRGNAEQ